MSVRSPTAGTWSSSQWRPDNEFETAERTVLEHCWPQLFAALLHESELAHTDPSVPTPPRRSILAPTPSRGTRATRTRSPLDSPRLPARSLGGRTSARSWCLTVRRLAPMPRTDRAGPAVPGAPAASGQRRGVPRAGSRALNGLGFRSRPAPPRAGYGPTLAGH